MLHPAHLVLQISVSVSRGHDGAFGRYRWAEVDAERGGDPYVAAGLAAAGQALARVRAEARTEALDPPLEPGAATAVI